VYLENAYEWKAKLAAWREEVPELRFVFVPYYWPILSYLTGWAGLLIWRKRKFEKRQVK
jgi:tryptophan-rich sensory protein